MFLQITAQCILPNRRVAVPLPRAARESTLRYEATGTKGGGCQQRRGPAAGRKQGRTDPSAPQKAGDSRTARANSPFSDRGTSRGGKSDYSCRRSGGLRERGAGPSLTTPPRAPRGLPGRRPPPGSALLPGGPRRRRRRPAAGRGDASPPPRASRPAELCCSCWASTWRARGWRLPPPFVLAAARGPRRDRALPPRPRPGRARLGSARLGSPVTPPGAPGPGGRSAAWRGREPAPPRPPRRPAGLPPAPARPATAPAPPPPPPRLAAEGSRAWGGSRPRQRQGGRGRRLPRCAAPHLPPLPAGAAARSRRAAAAMFAGAGARRGGCRGEAFPSPRQPARRRPRSDSAGPARPGPRGRGRGRPSRRAPGSSPGLAQRGGGEDPPPRPSAGTAGGPRGQGRAEGRRGSLRRGGWRALRRVGMALPRQRPQQNVRPKERRGALEVGPDLPVARPPVCPPGYPPPPGSAGPHLGKGRRPGPGHGGHRTPSSPSRPRPPAEPRGQGRKAWRVPAGVQSVPVTPSSMAERARHNALRASWYFWRFLCSSGRASVLVPKNPHRGTRLSVILNCELGPGVQRTAKES